jgi:preprotein translocase SecF subunit
MEIFKRTNFDFLGRKWPFILLSLLLTIAGLVSLWMKGGPKYGIDFTGGALMDVNFIKRPAAESIRAALRHKIAGEIEVQEIRNTQEVLISTGARDDNALQVVRGDMISTLNSAFNPAEAGQAAGRFDINLTSQAALADHLREPLTRGGVLLSEDQLQAVTKAITSYRDTPPRSGLISNVDDLSSVPGVTAPFLKVLKQESFAGNFAIRSVETVGPRIGADLRQQAINVVLIALAAMLVYIAFRFEWKYGVAAVIAVFHDTIITIGLFSILGKQIDLTVIAALLTLVGYSMNDTIVTFDRVRENLKLHVRGTFPSIVNLSINQTLSRTVLTSGLTFLTALSLFLFGGQVLNGFSLALVIGIIIGTYSSIFIASPILVFWHDVVAGKTGQAKPAAVEVRPAGTGKGVKTAKTVK